MTHNAERGSDDNRLKNQKRSEYKSLGFTLGMSIGVALALALDNWAFVGIGIVLWAAFSADS